MSDKELLELAAKAAGRVVEGFSNSKGLLVSTGDGTSAWWNPLTTDGDALRLAATLKIDIEWQSTGPFPEPHVEDYQRNAEGSCFCASEHEDDYRRAIVRAAAELGKAKP